MRKNPYFHFFSFFGLRENPFAGSPDPSYLYVTPQIQEAWDALANGIQSREGIILLTGEAGTGKTTLINRLLEWLHERGMPVAFIFNSHLEPRDLFDFLLSDFGVRLDPRWQGNALLGLGQWLHERSSKGQIPVLIVDEAQGLPVHVLEEIRLLMNLETPHEKLLQIVLAGQRELEEKLKLPEMRHLKQRIALRCKTGVLTLKETEEYIQLRLNVAGAAGKSIFSPDAMNAVHAYSRGIPRVMNLLCEHALINAYAANMHVVPSRVVNEVAREFQFDLEPHAPSAQIRAAETPARIYEPLVFSEAPPAPVQAAVRDVTSPPEIVVIQALAATPERIPILAAREQPGGSLPDRNGLVLGPLASDQSYVLASSSTANAASNKPAMKTSEADVSGSRPKIARILATRTPRMLSPIILAPIIPSPMIRSDAVKSARDFRASLHRAWGRICDLHVFREVANTVTRTAALGARRVHAASFGEYGSLRHMWQDAASPALQRIKVSLLNWLRQPLDRQHSSIRRKRITRRSNVWLKLRDSLTLLRSWRRAQEKFQPIVRLSDRIKVNAPVQRWLRQPFRSPHSLHSASRATTQRNRISSAL